MIPDKIKSKTKYPFNIKCVYEFTVYATTKEEAVKIALEKKEKDINKDLYIEYVSPVISLDEIISSD